MPLAQDILNRNRRALAKGISAVENDPVQRRELLKALGPHTGRAHVVGITGSPGAGKSSLVNQLTGSIRKSGRTVGVLAVDPTSPFSGGALLGDRIRMQDHLSDFGVFVRSMGSRGSFGGLARATKDAIQLLDAFGTDVILVETVGVGQLELDVMYAVDTTVLVLTPGAGDLIQTLKAGIMEIADIFVVNKADLDGANGVAMDVEGLLALEPEKAWRPPILLTTTRDVAGYDALDQTLTDHHRHLSCHGRMEQKRIARVQREIVDIAVARIRNIVENSLSEPGIGPDLVRQVTDRRMDAYTAAEQILAALPHLTDNNF